MMGRSVAPLLAGPEGSRRPPTSHTHTLVAGIGAVLHRAPAAPGCLHKAGGAEPLTDPEHTGDGGDLGGAELHPEKHPDPYVSLKWGHPGQ